MTRRPPKPLDERLHIRLHPDVRRALALRARETGKPQSALVEEALERLLWRDDETQARDAQRLFRVLERLARDVRIHLELDAVFIESFLRYAPEIPVGEQRETQHLGDRRMKQLVAWMEERLSKGETFVDTLAKEKLGDPRELAAAAAHPTAEPMES